MLFFSDTFDVDDVFKRDVFDETPIMPTYLIAFIVSKFQSYSEYVGSSPDQDPEYDVFSRRETIDTAEYSYEVGPPLLQVLDDYTQIPYYTELGIPKMHQVAIPDFSAGAMENWGLVTYR